MKSRRQPGRWRGFVVAGGTAMAVAAAAWLLHLRREVPHSDIEPTQAGAALRPKPVTGSVAPIPVSAPPEELSAALSALEQDSPSGRAAAMEEVAAAWMKADPLAAMTWARQVPNGIERERVQRIFIRAWAALDAPAAARFVASAPDSRVRQQWIRELCNEWASSDARAAAAWSTQLEEGRGRDVALQSVARVTVATLPELAVQLAQAIGSPERFQESFHDTVYQWSQTDASAAANWLRSLPEDDVTRTLAVQAAADAWSAWSPADAAAEMVRLPDGESRVELISDAARRWAETNPADATRWAASALDERTRERVFDEVVPVWAGIDPSGVGSWLNGLASGGLRDQLVGSFATAIAESSPERAMEWASTIADNATLRVRMEMIRDVWAEQDSEAARAWVAKSSLSAALKSQLLAGQ